MKASRMIIPTLKENPQDAKIASHILLLRSGMIKAVGGYNTLTGNKAGINYVARRDWDAKTKLLSSIEKAKDILGYSPKISFDDGLEKTHDWFVENWGNIQKSAEF